MKSGLTDKILHLTLKKQWFDMIKSGEKKEEYRELKKYWGSRFLQRIETPHRWSLSPWADIENGDFNFTGWSKFVSPNSIYKQFDFVIFKNGYSSNAPLITIECKGITVGEGRSEWGAPSGKCFVIKLGSIIN